MRDATEDDFDMPPRLQKPRRGKTHKHIARVKLILFRKRARLRFGLRRARV
jgi:hypothetical protein